MRFHQPVVGVVQQQQQPHLNTSSSLINSKTYNQVNSNSANVYKSSTTRASDVNSENGNDSCLKTLHSILHNTTAAVVTTTTGTTTAEAINNFDQSSDANRIATFENILSFKSNYFSNYFNTNSFDFDNGNNGHHLNAEVSVMGLIRDECPWDLLLRRDNVPFDRKIQLKTLQLSIFSLQASEGASETNPKKLSKPPNVFQFQDGNLFLVFLSFMRDTNFLLSSESCIINSAESGKQRRRNPLARSLAFFSEIDIGL